MRTSKNQINIMANKSSCKLREAGETGRIEVFEGKPCRPEHVCLSDVVAFIKNADAREFKIIRLNVEGGAL